MALPIAKLKAILLYFGTFTDPRFLGKVKLMKLFYFLDFMHVKKYGSPITYDHYVKLEHGPIPSTILNLVNAAEDIDHSVLADTIQIERIEGYDMHRVRTLRKFQDGDKKYFSTNELEILALVCERFGNKNTKYIEEASHNEAPWKESVFLETIPYTKAAHDSDCLVSRDEIELSVQL